MPENSSELSDSKLGVAPIAAEEGTRMQIRTVSWQDAVAGLNRIFGELQETHHDQWNWMDAGFFLEVLKCQIEDAVSHPLPAPPNDAAIELLGLRSEVAAVLELVGGPTKYPGTDWHRTLVDEVKNWAKPLPAPIEGTQNESLPLDRELGEIIKDHLHIEVLSDGIRPTLHQLNKLALRLYGLWKKSPLEEGGREER